MINTMTNTKEGKMTNCKTTCIAYASHLAVCLINCCSLNVRPNIDVKLFSYEHDKSYIGKFNFKNNIAQI